MAISPGPGVTGGSISGVGVAWPMARPDPSNNVTLGWPLSVQVLVDRFLKTTGV